MFTKTRYAILELLAIVGTTTVFVCLILFPMTYRHFLNIVGIFWKNIGLVPSMFIALMHIRKEELIPLWILVVGFPFISLFVLLDEYE